MPWHIVSSGSNWKVVNKETGRVMGTHSTKDKAKEQLKALYANVKE